MAVSDDVLLEATRGDETVATPAVSATVAATAAECVASSNKIIFLPVAYNNNNNPNQTNIYTPYNITLLRMGFLDRFSKTLELIIVKKKYI